MQKQVIKFTNRSPYPNSIFIGNEDDNLARQVQFVLPSEIDGAKIYLHLSIGEYSDVIELDDSLIYVPTRTHTQYPGNWTGYLEAHAGNDTVWHSNTFTFKVGDLPDSGEQIEQTYPSAIEEALRAVDTLTGVGARAVTLEPGSDATVSFEEDAGGKRTIIYGIPRGADGSGGGGGSGSDGATFTPSVSDEGVISWTNDKDLPNPDPVNIKGADGTTGADGKSAYQFAVEGGYTGTKAEFAAKLAQDKYVNPNALTFTGAVTGSYDGSEAVTVEIPSGGGGSGDGGIAETLIADFTTAEDVTQIDIPISDDLLSILNNAREIIYEMKFLLPSSDEGTAFGKLQFGHKTSWGMVETYIYDAQCLPTNSSAYASESYLVGSALFSRLTRHCHTIYAFMFKNTNIRTTVTRAGGDRNFLSGDVFRVIGSIPIGAGSGIRIYARG